MFITASVDDVATGHAIVTPMQDPYEILGVKKDATEAEIRAAYRKLAKLHHPDINPGKADAEERFKAISVAYGLLSDSDKRARFDRGEIDASGAERPPERRFYRDFGDRRGGGKYRPESGFDGDLDADDLASIFAQAFGQRGGQDFGTHGRHVRYALEVSFLDAANGAVRRLSLPDGRTLDVTIPAGLSDGQTLRLPGQGLAGAKGQAPGDALIEVRVAPHPYFRRDGRDIILILPVTIKEAIVGAKIEVPTVKGAVSLNIPPRSGERTRLRLKDRGIAGGHQYVELKIVMPSEPEPELAEFLEGWTPRHPYSPRKGMDES